MDRSAQNRDRCGGSEFMNLRSSVVSMDRSAQNIDRSSDSEIMDLRRMKFVFDVAPLEILDGKELLLFEEENQVFFHGVAVPPAVVAAAAAIVGVETNINQINLVIHVVNHDLIFQYWSPKSNHQQQLNSSSCHGDQHHRDHHHLREDDDDKEMIMLTCQPSFTPDTTDIVLNPRGGGGVYASADDDDDDYIMSLLRDLDILYEIEWIFEHQQLEEVKRCIIQRINESKPAVLLAKPKPKTVRIRLDLSIIMKKYYANPAAAASEYADDQLFHLEAAEEFAIHYPAAPPTCYDHDKPSRTPLTTALKSSKEALETKILEAKDLISSSSSSSCSVCLDEFCVGVDEIKKMPCSHMFHRNCLMNWLQERNTCPLCYYPLPTFASRFLEDPHPLPRFLP